MTHFVYYPPDFFLAASLVGTQDGQTLPGHYNYYNYLVVNISLTSSLTAKF